MKRAKSFLFLTTLVLVVLLDVAPGEETRGRIHGRIVDPANMPERDVHVRLQQSGKSDRQVLSGKDGDFEFRSVRTGSYIMRVEARGFPPISIDFDQHSDDGAVELGVIQLKISCAVPGVICDEIH